MTKTYTFYADSWWDDPGCSCCPSTFIEVYNCPDTSRNHGSAHCIEDCYVQAIVTEVGEDATKYYEMSLEQLEMKAQELGIKIEIIVLGNEEG